ncbi:MAG TPA: hypothetical protein VGG42_09960 [Acidobacteriaceae bacterium]|jgi:hypothetical protein
MWKPASIAPPEPVIVTFDSSLVPLCGSLGATLLFCWYEQVFAAAGYPEEGITRPRLSDWRVPIGYGLAKSATYWYSAFYRIGVIHQGRHVYAANVRAFREFVSDRLEGYAFYSLEVHEFQTTSILHRNHAYVDHRLAELRNTPPPAIRKPAGKRDGIEAATRVAQVVERTCSP